MSLGTPTSSPFKHNVMTVFLEPWHVSVFDTLERIRLSATAVVPMKALPDFSFVTNNLFEKRVALDGEWSLFAPRQVPDLATCAAKDFEALYCQYEAIPGKAIRTIKAREVLMAVAKTQAETGIPWVVARESRLYTAPSIRLASVAETQEHESSEARMKREGDIIDQVKANGSVRIARASLTGEASRSLTLTADRAGLITYKERDETGRIPYIVVASSRDEACDPDALTVPQLRIFSDLCNVPLDDLTTLREDMKLYGVADASLDAFVEDVRRFSLVGLKRRDRILKQEIVNYLASQPEYVAFQQLNPPPTLEGKMDDAFTIFKHVYDKKNANRVFFSIDLKSAIFQCFRDLGIVKEATSWSEFVARFSNSRLVAMNKFMRNCIFGELDKKNTHHVLWKNAIWRVWQQILSAWPEAQERMIAIENDEFILDCPEGDDAITIATDAQRLLGPCGLATLIDVGRINLRCYRLHPLRLEATASQPAESCYIRQMIDYNTGHTTSECDVKCVKRPNRKRAMLIAQSLYAVQKNS